jgi:hypothetical protein
VPRILIELSDEEYQALLRVARSDRRTAQAEAAQLLVGILREWVEKGKFTAPTTPPEMIDWSAEVNRPPLSAGGALAAQQDVGAEQGHGDGPAAGVNQVVVGRPGEPE